MPRPEERSWWSRNWIWVVPAGCLGILLMPVACVAGLGLLLYGTITSSDLFSLSLETAQNHPAIIEALGQPVEHGWLFEGSIDINGSTGDADYSITISGPKGNATLHVVAEKHAGEWEFETLEVELEDGRRIDLLESTNRAGGPSTVGPA